jgi:hypothetical protein
MEEERKYHDYGFLWQVPSSLQCSYQRNGIIGPFISIPFLIGTSYSLKYKKPKKISSKAVPMNQYSFNQHEF